MPRLSTYMGMKNSPSSRQARNHAAGVSSRNVPTETAIERPRPACVLASEYTHTAAANRALAKKTAISPAVAASTRIDISKTSCLAQPADRTGLAQSLAAKSRDQLGIERDRRARFRPRFLALSSESVLARRGGGEQRLG